MKAKNVFGWIMAFALFISFAGFAPTASADVADYPFFVGTWTYSGESTSNHTTTLTFYMNGTGLYVTEGSGFDSEEDFNWSLTDNGTIIFDWGNYEDECKYDFNSMYTEVTFTYMGEFGGEWGPFEKKGNVCGVCCPMCFVYFGLGAIGMPILALLRRKNKY